MQRRLFYKILFGCVALVEWGCSSQTAASADPEAGVVLAGGGEAGGGVARVDPGNVAQVVAAKVPEVMAATQVPVRAVDQTQAQVEQALKVLGATKGAQDSLRHVDLLKSYYPAMQFKTIFVSEGKLTGAGRIAFDFISDAGRHGLDVDKYHVEALRGLIAQAPVEAAEGDTGESEALAAASTLTDQERAALTKYLAQHPDAVDPKDAASVEKFTQWLLTEDVANPVPRLAQARVALQEAAAAEAAVDLGSLEILLADAYLSYAHDMHHGNLNRFSDEERKLYRVPMGEELDRGKHAQTVVRERLLKELAAFDRLAGDATAANDHIKALWPVYPQYEKLVEARQRYVGFVQAGGWKVVASGKLNPKGKSPRVKQLKERLVAEGYFTGTVDEVFDAELGEAVKRYQETHQLEVTGLVADKNFWSSLNIPAEERLKQIDVNLRRWRHESRMIPSDYFVYINVPDFHAEIWREQVREMRFRIVVGNTHRACDPKQRRIVYDNATPLQHAILSNVIFNPYWNVPPRIEQEEYLPKMAENPNWLAENGFEYVSDGGNTYLRQLPGPGNALGTVKFIFPNKHNTYMHDTAQKSLFKYPVRAFSHGCMRVHEPMKLAEHLLSAEGKWDQAKISKIYESSKEHGVRLENPLDVFIEYNTTRVDEEGNVHFLADVYKFVRRETHPNEKYDQKCTPEPTVTYTRPGEADPAADDGGMGVVGGFGTGP
jgi:murein L,D-transpeptidase YcbB/YkuD